MPPSTSSNRQEDPPRRPLFKPAVILHGGAGNIHRSRLPPDLYNQYRTSLLTYLRSTAALLNVDLQDPRNSSSIDDAKDTPYTSPTALNAAVHAVSLMEDDELFNCGRGSVFTSAGTIEMEASVMVASLFDDEDNEDSSQRGPSSGSTKRGAGVMLIRNVRHPIQLAREVLLRTGYTSDDGGNMHSQLSGEYVEGLAREWGLEFCPDDWFWTKKRWDEHMRGLEKGRMQGRMTGGGDMGVDVDGKGSSDKDGPGLYLSQGTVGCVCLDRWGNIAVATSTGGLTNKCPGRIGDTPTLGAGFWAEAWDVEAREMLRDGGIHTGSYGSGSLEYQSESKREMLYPGQEATPVLPSSRTLSTTPTFSESPWPFDFYRNTAFSLLRDCFSPPPGYAPVSTSRYLDEKAPIASPPSRYNAHTHPNKHHHRRILALSGTGNGDSFLRTAATRTAAAMARFSSSQNPVSLNQAVTFVAGPGGELQRSAGRRWGKTGEGEGGVIGIEAEAETGFVGFEKLRKGKVVFDFNCGGMFRAWMEERDGKGVERMMVFREEYE
ncbi:hypothetical protein AJ79_03144 [Helicocarpus griseus UAMH5409]|uniref:L-asparaginase n=1 Tax=Helicocarpus griseus UAMH5409 TaxID=1447875 RepID=A0A2B7Y0C8_9EURO|nr:hypothetical protein AJ79_03144 [Helicocarpus griseus UAMH5409]